MAKKEKVVDLKPTPEKITDEQLSNVQDIVSKINQGQMEVGRLETNKHSVMHQIVVLQEALQKLQKELEDEYGKVNVNIQTGEIKPVEDEQANS
tara:strand:+ start:28 stop:309 length:282 start_codon:yes stop_codon:yes gene_type:complete